MSFGRNSRSQPAERERRTRVCVITRRRPMLGVRPRRSHDANQIEKKQICVRVAQKVICLHCAAEEIAEAIHANEAISEWTHYAPEHVLLCATI
jgi:hypothetical protein